MNGLHLIAGLYRCCCEPGIIFDREVLEACCVEECRNAGLTPSGAYFVQFRRANGDKAGVTGTVMLTESHLAIHTWPESGNVTLDVYVCSCSRNKDDRARQVFAELFATLQPDDSIRHEISRGSLREEN